MSADIENCMRIFITFFNISSFTDHTKRFWMKITNSAVFTVHGNIYPSEVTIFSLLASLHQLAIEVNLLSNNKTKMTIKISRKKNIFIFMLLQFSRFLSKCSIIFLFLSLSFSSRWITNITTWVQIPGFILISRTETSSLLQVVSDDGTHALDR